MDRQNDRAVLTGIVAAPPSFSHSGRMGEYFTFPLEVERLSGAVDTLNIIAARELCEAQDLKKGERITLRGEIRSYNNRSGAGARLVLTVLARSIERTSAQFENSVRLEGVLVKLPSYRKTPMGREICDLMLAVQGRYGKSDYLPCIVWGIRAREAADWEVGQKLLLRGRMQSRKYIKATDNGQEEKTAFEISVSDVEAI